MRFAPRNTPLPPSRLRTLSAAILFTLFYVINLSAASADTGTMIKTCRGVSSQGPYSLSIWHNAFVSNYDNKYFAERHTFDFQGILAPDKDAKAVIGTPHWIIYKGDKHWLLVPWNVFYSVYMKPMTEPGDTPDESPTPWEMICR